MANDCVQLCVEPIDVAEAMRFVTDPAAGGITFFLGTTRAARNAEGQDLLALDYEAYPEMALSQLRSLALRARQKWRLLRLVLLHRTGRVAVGQPSVLIAVSTPHRAEAFEACRWFIDTLKAEAAIWKKEIWSDGSGTWVQPGLATDGAAAFDAEIGNVS